MERFAKTWKIPNKRAQNLLRKDLARRLFELNEGDLDRFAIVAFSEVSHACVKANLAQPVGLSSSLVG